MTVNSELVLNYLKQNYGKEFSKQEVAAALGISIQAVTGCINSYVKKGYVENTRQDTVVDAEATETRKARTHVVNYHRLTPEGLEYDPIAEAEAKAAKKAKAKAE